ncbi:nucleotide disphospho-sugar-binding domain-containing protein, partial [Streptomyces roseolus]|uniref:nucleotide disphospho-sugar-binding domain-containing protein n=1 Tax=Streptomyces roseolus TaxID=67358 RepID=UPI00366844ED
HVPRVYAGDASPGVEWVDPRPFSPGGAGGAPHGGAGTTTTAARAGVPQVVVPRAGDQPYWADRVTALGLGAARPAPSPEALSAALATALRPDTRARAQAVRGRIRDDGAAVAARLLCEAAGR